MCTVSMTSLGIEESAVNESVDQDFSLGFTSLYGMTLGKLQNLLCLTGFQIFKMEIKIIIFQGCLRIKLTDILKKKKTWY